MAARIAFVCCPPSEGEKSKSTKAFEVFIYTTVVLELTDAVFDYMFVVQLAQDEATKKYAVWLGICTTIALLLELVMKTGMRLRKTLSSNNTNGSGEFNMHSAYGFNSYVMLCATMELCIFFVEDTTTVFVWWQTGLYTGDLLSKANLITTLASALVTGLAGVYGIIQFIRAKPSRSGIVYLGLLTVLFLGGVTFWAWFALSTIISGDFYACTGSVCNTRTIESGEAFVDGSGYTSGDGTEKAVALNHAAIGVYVVGWIVGVISTCATCALIV